MGNNLERAAWRFMYSLKYVYDGEDSIPVSELQSTIDADDAVMSELLDTAEERFNWLTVSGGSVEIDSGENLSSYTAYYVEEIVGQRPATEELSVVLWRGLSLVFEDEYNQFDFSDLDTTEETAKQAKQYLVEEGICSTDGSSNCSTEEAVHRLLGHAES